MKQHNKCARFMVSLVFILGVVIISACAGRGTPVVETATTVVVADENVKEMTAPASPVPVEQTTTPSPTPEWFPYVQRQARTHYTFDEIWPHLNTPELVLEFMKNNLIWDGGWDNKTYGDNAYSPAAEVYQNGIDDCDGLAEFAACVLSKNGYEAYNVGISILGPFGHNVTGFVGNDGLKYAINDGQSMDGPFNSWEELAQYYIDNKSAEPNGVIWLFQPCIPERAVGEAMLDLPHIVFR
jgi:hypothetical protein